MHAYLILNIGKMVTSFGGIDRGGMPEPKNTMRAAEVENAVPETKNKEAGFSDPSLFIDKMI